MGLMDDLLRPRVSFPEEEARYRATVQAENSIAAQEAPQAPQQATAAASQTAVPPTPGQVAAQAPQVNRAWAQEKIADMSPAAAPQAPQGTSSLWELNRILEQKRQTLTDQEEAEAQKKANRYALIAALGDGISAISNLYYSTKGAPPIEQPQYLGHFRRHYLDAKAKREALREQLMQRLYENSREAQKQAQQRILLKAKQDYDDKKYDRERQDKAADDRDKYLRDMGLLGLRLEHSSAEGEKNRQAKAREAALGRENQRAITQMRAATNKSGANDYFYLSDGKTGLNVPKAAENAVYGFLYKRMQELAPQKGQEIDDVKLALGEGGDQLSKMKSIVSRRLKDFPELLPEVSAISRMASGYDYMPEANASGLNDLMD